MFYRQLARTLSGNRSSPELEKCAHDLEERASAMEDYARRGGGLKADSASATGDVDDQEATQPNAVTELQIAVALAFEDAGKSASS